MFGRKHKQVRIRKSDLYVVVSNNLDHAHGPYDDLETAVKLAIEETRASGLPHMPVAFDFTTGVIIKADQIAAAQKQAAEREDAVSRGYL